MELYTCDRPFCLDDGIVQIKELRFTTAKRVTFLKNGRMRDLCLRHAEEVTKDNIFITDLRKKTELRKKERDALH
tara:strand:+ start:776 stop:1000 length:225 start_codon:yes stop_codon:yes gene_type:complete